MTKSSKCYLALTGSRRLQRGDRDAHGSAHSPDLGPGRVEGSLPLANVLLQLLVMLLVHADLLGGDEVLVKHPAQNIKVINTAGQDLLVAKEESLEVGRLLDREQL